MVTLITTVFAFVVTISVLVTVHEFGHFFVARKCGVRVQTFSIGFGKKLFSWKDKQQTEYCISFLPLGGYVRMLDGRVDTLTEENSAFAFDQKPIFKRALIILAGPIANFILAVIIYWSVFMLGVPSYPAKIAQITPNSIASQMKITPGVELKAIASIKVENWKDVRQVLLQQIGKNNVAFFFQPEGSNIQQMVYVDLTHWRPALEKEDLVVSLGFIPSNPRILLTINDIVRSSSAFQVGLKEGDKLIAVNGKLLVSWQQFSEIIKHSPGKMLDLQINRNEQIMNFVLTPATRKNLLGQDEGFAGIVPLTDVIIQRYTIVDALVKGLQETKNMIAMSLHSFWLLITGALDLKNLSGPVTIAKVAGDSANNGISAFLAFLGFISISLGVVNLFPLPVLDGGHLLLLFIEKIKGRPLSLETQGFIYRIGIILLLMLMGLALFNDLSRL